MEKIGGAFESLTGSGSNTNQVQSQGQSDQQGGDQQQSTGEGGLWGSLGDKLNSAVGGGSEGQKNEDLSNKSDVEQAKDEQVSEFIRSKYKSDTDGDIPAPNKQI